MNWNNELIINELKQLIAGNCLKHFPSASEIRSLGRNDLVCAMKRNGGFKKYQLILNMKPKLSDSHKGWIVEDEIFKLIRNLGYDCKSTREHPKCEYDLLVDNKVRIDVKYSNKNNKYNSYSFRLAKKEPTCDYYCLVTDTGRIFFIPSELLKQTQITVTDNEKCWERFLKFEI